jgi:hypothetical protein
MKPDRQSFKRWTKYLKSCFLKPYNGVIPSLGKWIMQEVHKSHTFMGYYQHDTNYGYIREEQGRYPRY